MNAQGFRWHPAARLFGPDGAKQRPSAACPASGAVILEAPPALALAQALAAGDCFAIRSAVMAGVPAPVPPEPGQPAIFETLTSGSSGQPRRIRRSQHSWVASFEVNAGLFGLAPGRRIAVPGALTHSLSLYGALEGLYLGAEVHLLAGVRPDRQHAMLASAGIDTLYATPAQLRALCPYAPLPALRLVLCGGSKLDAKLRSALAALAPQAQIREFYGAAETSFISLADEQTPEGSVGRPYPGVEIRLGNGEVFVRSPYLFEAYADADGRQAVAGVADATAQQGWLSVGEMGRLQEGYLWLEGRRGRMVTIADQNVFPEAIEEMLETLPGITRAAVLPEHDPKRGSVIFAVCMGDPACEAAVMAELRARLGPLKAPRRLIWRADWPQLASGKSDFAALRAAHCPDHEAGS